jgi:hypothetical protein
MTVQDLIAVLRGMPQQLPICILDWRKNLTEWDNDPNNVGIYPRFDIEVIDPDELPNNDNLFVAISFENTDYTYDGKKANT